MRRNCLQVECGLLRSDSTVLGVQVPQAFSHVMRGLDSENTICESESAFREYVASKLSQDEHLVEPSFFLSKPALTTGPDVLTPLLVSVQLDSLLQSNSSGCIVICPGDAVSALQHSF